MNKKFLMFLAVTSMTLGAVSCDKKSKDQGSTAEEVPAIDTLALDQSVSPREDFYQFANGGWRAANPLPAEYSRYGSFDVLREKAEASAHEIILDLKDNYAAGSDEEKAYKLYEMSIDAEKLDADGATPILPYLAEVDKISSKEELVDYIAKEGNYGDSHFFSFYVAPDEKNSSENILQLSQASLIMGGPDYYGDDDSFAKQQADYHTYMTKLFSLVGASEEDAKAIAEQVYGTEKSLSKILYTMLEMRDSERNYNKMSMTDFYTTFSFPWERYMSGRNGLKDAKEVNVAQKDYFHRFDKWFTETSLDNLKNLIKAQILDDGAGYLSSDFRQASFDFHSASMAGITEQKPLWKKAIARINGSMGDVLGQKYVEKYFPAEAKERMIDLIGNLSDALGDRINNLSWMGDDTKAKAHEKLDTFIVKVGYPDKWWTYEDLELVESSLYEYARAISLFQVNRNLKDLGEPVDPSRWLMNAHEVNAYYNPTTNEICFPAGILQPPFFNLNADDAVNYGGIGVVIGHEMTHGFDDQGSNYNAQGNMENWWTESDREIFAKSVAKLAEQFSKVEIRTGLKADGKLTLGENIADQGGVLVSYDALQKATAGKDYPEIDGFTKDQRFFIGYARLWGQNISPEEEVLRTKTDVHSLGKLRVNQTLKNVQAFYDAFGVKEGDAMYMAPEDRVIVW